MQNIDIINLVGAVQNPTSTSSPDQTTPQFTSGRQSELCISEVHGKYYIAAYRGKVFHGQNTAFTIPVVGATSASKFTLYNPASSPVLAEIFSTELNCLVAPEVVDTFGWYAALPSNIAAGTFTTLTAPTMARIGDGASNLVQFYTAYTHATAAPTRVDVVGSYGAASTTGGPGTIRKEHDGKLLLMPGQLISLLASTTITTAVSMDGEAIWAEWPL